MMVRNEICLNMIQIFFSLLGKRIYKQFHSSLIDTGEDIHAKLMMQYPEVPSWWYVE
jgi:hypothetical protein